MNAKVTARKMIAVMRKIPPGRVATYGQIAALAAKPANSRQVGTVLRQLPDDSDVPWHRVLNAQGRISDRGNSTVERLQRFLLRQEGVKVTETGRVDLAVFQWQFQQEP